MTRDRTDYRDRPQAEPLSGSALGLWAEDDRVAAERSQGRTAPGNLHSGYLAPNSSAQGPQSGSGLRPGMTYPGSTQQIRTYGAEDAQDVDRFLNGMLSADVEAIAEDYSDAQEAGLDELTEQIGALAKKLIRRPRTIRSWIDQGIIPEPARTAGVPVQGVNGTKGSSSKRVWSKRQVNYIVQVAKEEGIIYTPRNAVNSTNFSARVKAAWPSLCP